MMAGEFYGFRRGSDWIEGFRRKEQMKESTCVLLKVLTSWGVTFVCGGGGMRRFVNAYAE